MVNSQPKEGDVKKKEGETSTEPVWGRNSGNSAVIFQAWGGKCKDYG